MASKLQTAVDVETGKALLEELSRLSDQTAAAVAQIKQIGANYKQFIDRLDADDKTFANQSLGRAIARDKATLDAMDAADRAVVDTYLQGLGYAKV